MKHLKFLIVTLVIVLGFFIYYEYSKINDLWAIESPTMGDTCANNGFIKCDNEAELFINQVEFQDMQNNEPDLLILNLTNNGAMDINVGWHLIKYQQIRLIILHILELHLINEKFCLIIAFYESVISTGIPHRGAFNCPQIIYLTIFVIYKEA